MHTARRREVVAGGVERGLVANRRIEGADVEVRYRTTVENVFVDDVHFLAEAYRGKASAFLEQSGRQLLKGGGQHHFLHFAVIEGAHAQLGQSVGEDELLHAAFAEGIVAHAFYGGGQCVFALLAHRKPEDALAVAALRSTPSLLMKRVLASDTSMASSDVQPADVLTSLTDAGMVML